MERCRDEGKGGWIELTLKRGGDRWVDGVEIGAHKSEGVKGAPAPSPISPMMDMTEGPLCIPFLWRRVRADGD